MTTERRISLEESVPIDTPPNDVLPDVNAEGQTAASATPCEVGVIDGVRVVDSPYLSRSGLSAKALLAMASMAIGEFMPAQRSPDRPDPPTGEGHIDYDFRAAEVRALLGPRAIDRVGTVSSAVHDSVLLDRLRKDRGLYGKDSRFRLPADENPTASKRHGRKKASVQANRRKMAKASRLINRKR